MIGRVEMTLAMHDTAPAWTKTRFGAALVLVLRLGVIGAALCLMIISIPLFLMPIPLGIPLFIVSLIMLAAASKTAHGHITRKLRRHPAIWRRVKGAFGE
ncbi:hypothetical protein FKB34_16150 [Glycocaulis profundi]|nr:hypothetical protein FKB34_16150 [Glycocaulis profundi]